MRRRRFADLRGGRQTELTSRRAVAGDTLSTVDSVEFLQSLDN